MAEPGAPTPTPPPSEPQEPYRGFTQQYHQYYGAPPQQPYGQRWPTPVPPRDTGTNGFAIAALVCGVLPLIPLAIVFGIIALGQLAGSRRGGRWLAVAGLAAAGVWTAGLVVSGVPDQLTRSDRTLTTWSVLQDGECIDGLSSLDPEGSPSPSDLPEVPCSGPHEGEVFATFDLEDGDYPGEAAVSRETESRCRDLLRSTPPDTVGGAVIGYIFLFPLETWWPEHRTVVCVAYDPQDVQVPGVGPIPEV